MRKKILLPIIIFTLSLYNVGYAQENKQVTRAYPTLYNDNVKIIIGKSIFFLMYNSF